MQMKSSSLAVKTIASERLAAHKLTLSSLQFCQFSDSCSTNTTSLEPGCSFPLLRNEVATLILTYWKTLSTQVEHLVQASLQTGE